MVTLSRNNTKKKNRISCRQLFCGFYLSILGIICVLNVYYYVILKPIEGKQQQQQQQQQRQLQLPDLTKTIANQTTTTTTTTANNKNNNNNQKKQNPNLIGSTGDPPPEKEEYHVPYNPIKDPDETISVCMLVMDDNHRLTEWLAYHSYILPLGHLIVGVDPRSQSDPSDLFETWRHQSGIVIDEWTEEQIYGSQFKHWQHILEKRKEKGHQLIWAHDHRQRQNMFLRNCLVHMKQVLKKTWVLIVDSDEYLLYNGPSGSTSTFDPSWKYPSLKKEGTIVKDFLQNDHIRSLYPNPCIVIPRMLFGANESLPEEIAAAHVPARFNATKFDTLRYRKHIRRSVTHSHSKNGWGKVLVDVSRIQSDDFPTAVQAFQTFPYYMTVHEPVPKVCARPFVKNTNTLLRINHYVGSWESFSYRNDARAAEGRGRQSWLDKAKYADETDDTIREWISGYVDEKKDEADTLLKDVGVFAPKTKNIHEVVNVIPHAKAVYDRMKKPVD